MAVQCRNYRLWICEYICVQGRELFEEIRERLFGVPEELRDIKAKGEERTVPRQDHSPDLGIISRAMKRATDFVYCLLVKRINLTSFQANLCHLLAGRKRDELHFALLLRGASPQPRITGRSLQKRGRAARWETRTLFS